MLEKLTTWWASLPYSITGGLIRAGRAGVSSFMSTILVSVQNGSFFPRDWDAAMIILLTGALLGLDKWLRERGVRNDDPVTGGN